MQSIQISFTTVQSNWHQSQILSTWSSAKHAIPLLNTPLLWRFSQHSNLCFRLFQVLVHDRYSLDYGCRRSELTSPRMALPIQPYPPTLSSDQGKHSARCCGARNTLSWQFFPSNQLILLCNMGSHQVSFQSLISPQPQPPRVSQLLAKWQEQVP